MRQQDFVLLMKETIRRMQIPEQNQAFRLIENRFSHRSFLLAYRHSRDLPEMKKQMKILLRNGALSPKEMLQYMKAALKIK